MSDCVAEKAAMDAAEANYLAFQAQTNAAYAVYLAAAAIYQACVYLCQTGGPEPLNLSELAIANQKVAQDQAKMICTALEPGDEPISKEVLSECAQQVRKMDETNKAIKSLLAA